MSKSGNLRCHGNVQYDITTDIVVYGVGGLLAVQIEDGRTSRCGREMLNPNREVCCNGQVHDVGSGKCHFDSFYQSGSGHNNLLRL